MKVIDVDNLVTFRYQVNPFENKPALLEAPSGSTIRECIDIIQTWSQDEDKVLINKNADELNDFIYPTICELNGAPICRHQWDTLTIAAEDLLQFYTIAGGGSSKSSSSKSRSLGVLQVVVGLALLPFSGPIGWGLIISGAFSVAASYIPTPDTPSAARPESRETSPTYQINARNIARPGEPIAVGYGRNRHTPDLAAPIWFAWEDDANGVRRKYSHQILCLGVGEYSVENVLIGNQPIRNVLDGSYTVYEPGEDSADSIDRENSIDVSSVEVKSLGSNNVSTALSWAHASYPFTEGTWATSTAYVAGDIMDVSATSYGGFATYAVCLADHTSGSDITDHGSSWMAWNSTLHPDYSILRGGDGDLVGSSKPGGQTSDNGNYSRIYVPDADEANNVHVRTVLYRISSEGGYDYLVISDRPAFYNAASPYTITPTADTETKEVWAIGDPDSIGYGPFRIPDASFIDIEFPNGIYTHAGGTVNVKYMIFVYDEGHQFNWVLLDYNEITQKSYIPWGETVTPSTPAETPYESYTGNRRSYLVARLDSELPNTTGIDRMLWTGLRYVASSPGANADTTRIKVKFAANSDIQSTGDKIKVIATRKLQTYDGSTWSDPTATQSAIWPICDLIMNATYGMGLSTSEFDFETLMNINDNFAYAWEFNGVFDQNMTRWDALTAMCRAAIIKPYMAGGKITFVHDGLAVSSYTQMFTMRNIKKDTWSYSREEPDYDEPDGVQVNYIDDYSWEQKTVSYNYSGGTPTDPEVVELFGVTDATQAGYIARHMANARHYRRNMVSFETEYEGHIAYPGEKCPVSFDLPRWGDSGEITAVSGLDLTLNKDVDWTGGPFEMYLRRPDGTTYGPVTVTQGGADNIATLPGALDFTPRTDGDGERTHFAFGEDAAEDVLIQEIEPLDDGSVRVNAVVYNANVYNGLPT